MELWVPDKKNIWIKKLISEKDRKEEYLPVNLNFDTSVSNLTLLPFLHEASVLDSLKIRYAKDEIYTFTGNTLLAINPYQSLDIYSLSENFPEAHVFTVAKRAYKGILSGKSQSIIANGESGAGKTVTTKHLLKYLCHQSGRKLGERIIKANPILEAFGNAKTIRNNNSSRFGKFIVLNYDDSDNLIGANIETYLLEKIRVTSYSQDEQSFHIFSIIENDKKKHNLISVMLSFGLTKSFINKVFSLIEGCKSLLKLAYPINKEKLTDIAKQIGWNVDELYNSLTIRTIKAGLEVVTIDLNESEFKIALKSLTQNLYENMFHEIVNSINELLNYENNSNDSNDSNDSIDSTDSTKFIGILDIFGFEVFQKNNLEQLCINYANEKLQDLFSSHVFKHEQNLYKEEQISWENIDFPNNQECLNFFEGKPVSFMTLLNEECILPKGNDKSLYNKVINRFEDNQTLSTKENKKMDLEFIVKHYAGKVTYTINDYIRKNRNRQINNNKSEKLASYFMKQLNSLIKVIKNTSQQYIRCIKPNDNDIKKTFDSSRVVEQLRYGGVIESIRVSRAGYPIRYPIYLFNNRYNIIINGLQFQSNELNKELHCLLLDKLDILSESDSDYQIGLTKVFIKKILHEKIETLRAEVLEKKSIIIGSFFKMTLAKLKYQKSLKAITLIQTIIRMSFSKRKLLHLRRQKANTLIMCYVIGYNIRRKYLNFKKAISLLKTKFRSYQNKIRLITKIQAIIKGYLIMKKYQKKKVSLIVIQSIIRRKIAFLIYRKEKRKLRDTTYLNTTNKELTRKLKKANEEIIRLKEIKETKESEQKNNNLKEQIEKLKKGIARRDKLIITKEKVNLELITKMGRLLQINDHLKNLKYEYHLKR